MKAKEFWHESLTEASWKKLQEFSKEINFTVIGGWSVWLWAKQHKSKDIDLIVDFSALELPRDPRADQADEDLQERTNLVVVRPEEAQREGGEGNQ